MSLKPANDSALGPDSSDSNGGRAKRSAWSLAAQLTAWYAISSFALVLIVLGFLYLSLSRYLEAEDDDFLSAKINAIKQVLREGVTVADLEKDTHIKWAPHEYERVFVRILDGNGMPILTTEGMDERLPLSSFPAAANRGGTVEGFDLRSVTNEPFRGMALHVEHHNGAPSEFSIQVAMSEAAEFQLLAKYRRRMFAVLAIAFVICVAGGFAIARRGIRPVWQISEAARRIRSTTLDKRIDRAGLPAEIDHLAATFNEMLNRLEDAFNRLSNFSADIAHELRTPVNTLRGEIEVALTHPRDTEEYRRVLVSSLEECQRLSRLIDSLLFLARAENPRTHVHKTRLDISRELVTICEFYEPAASDAGLRIELKCNAQEPLIADLDRIMFQRAMGNLVENAMRYTPKGGSIIMTGTCNNGSVRIEVADTGKGIPPEQLPRICERFHRVDHDRSRDTGGVGLGLAITKSIAALHDGSMEIASELGVGTRVTLAFPASAAAKPLTS